MSIGTMVIELPVQKFKEEKDMDKMVIIWANNGILGTYLLSFDVCYTVK